MTAAKHLLMAHGQAASAIREVYEEKGLKQPQIAPVLSVSYFMPANPSKQEDIELAAHLDGLYNHAWIQGVLTGTIPEPVGDGSAYPALKNSADFIGINYYSRMLVSSDLDFLAGEMPPKDPSLERCEGLDWEVYPEGYYEILKSFWNRYKKPIFLTENGIGTQNDFPRCRYIIGHLQQVPRIIQDGADIRGYLVWSLTDNFEWAQGYTSHFGLIGMDYKTLERKPRESAEMFRQIIAANGISKSLQTKYLRQPPHR
jgi:beta-glucosidase/6-phospho-beta-glucosidase/beta-galactosidase